MRTTLDINGTLLREAMTRAHTKTKRDTVERGLRELINAERRHQLIELAGKGYGLSLRTFLRARRDE